MVQRAVICAGWLAVAACTGTTGPVDDGDLRQGGDTTVDDRTNSAYSHPAANLTPEQVATFQLGSGPFDFQWQLPQLGPLYNNNACVGCHPGNGRGLSQIGQNSQTSDALIRVSLADDDPMAMPEVPGGDPPVPSYGLQLHDHNTNGLPDVVVHQSWTTMMIAYGDGTQVMLRIPAIDPRLPSGDELPANILRSYRQAPGAFGLGLLEAVPDAALMTLADPDDANGDGISGRVNTVWDSVAGAEAIGRFGHKATVPTVQAQAALAFAIDLGLTNKLFPNPSGSNDVSDDQLVQTTFFVSTIAVPAAAPLNAAAQRGHALFSSFGCDRCHVATLVTGDSAIAQLAHQTIHPYTDLLLHDMGDGLSDGRRDFTASGSEWRTAPLWGIGLVQLVTPAATFLHDGRATSLAEAILWHGGEAVSAREAFRQAASQQRDDLISFLQTL